MASVSSKKALPKSAASGAVPPWAAVRAMLENNGAGHGLSSHQVFEPPHGRRPNMNSPKPVSLLNRHSHLFRAGRQGLKWKTGSFKNSQRCSVHVQRHNNGAPIDMFWGHVCQRQSAEMVAEKSLSGGCGRQIGQRRAQGAGGHNPKKGANASARPDPCNPSYFLLTRPRWAIGRAYMRHSNTAAISQEILLVTTP